jgi:hypothetical protein
MSFLHYLSLKSVRCQYHMPHFKFSINNGGVWIIDGPPFSLQFLKAIILFNIEFIAIGEVEKMKNLPDEEILRHGQNDYRSSK